MAATTTGDDGLRVECAWCGRHVSGPDRATAERVSHGLCVGCAAESGMFEVENLFQLTEADADSLPWGRLVLDRTGTVLAYNVAEENLARRDRADVIGRNFFGEVAPCTAVDEFQGRFQGLVSGAAPKREEFDFIFRFQHGARLVSLSMAWDPAMDRAMVLVSAITSPDRASRADFRSI